MKNIFFVIMMAALMTLPSCKKFLEPTPQGLLSEDLLNTKSGVDGLANMAYSSLDTHFDGQWPDFFHPPSNWSFGDVRSDDAYKGGGGTGDIFEYHQLEIGAITPDNPMLYQKWRADYTGINNINTAIRALQKISEPEYAEKDTRIAEMKVLRGYFYLDLKKHFYQIPWIDETVATADYSKVSNDLSSEDLWAKIESDFSTAATVLPETQGDKSRVNRYVADAFLCKTYMFQNKYQQAIAEADKIINSAKYGLLDDFDKVYSLPEWEHGSEFIFSIAFSVRDQSPVGNLNWGELLNAPVKPYGGGDGFDRPSQNLVNAFKVDSNGLPLFDTYNQVDLSASNTTTPVDPRLDHAIGRPGIPWKDYTGDVYDLSWARANDVYGPYSKKKNVISPNSALRAGSGFPWALGALDFPLIKYTDVLLWKAEALVETNQNLEEARSIVNLIRNRAKNAPYVMKIGTTTPAANYMIEPYPAAGWTQDYARKAVRFETRLELCLEGRRFYDLVRWGIAAEVMNKFYQEEKTKRPYYGAATFIPNKHEYLPVPQSEIDRSQGGYHQNKFY